MDNLYEDIVKQMVGKYIKMYKVYDYYDDLIGVANLAVAEAISTYDKEKGEKESWIKLYVKNLLSNYIKRNILKHKKDVVNFAYIYKLPTNTSVTEILSVFNPLEKAIIYLALVERISYKDISTILSIDNVYKVRMITTTIKKYFKENYQKA